MPSRGTGTAVVFYMLNKIADCTENVVGNLSVGKGITLRVEACISRRAKRRLLRWWVVQDITRLILRLALRVATGGDFVEPAVGSHPARIGNSKKAPLGHLFTLVGPAGYYSSHPETRPAGRHKWRCKIAPGDFVEPAAGSHPARLSIVRRNEKSA